MIKRCFKVKDELMNEEFEVFGQGGILKRETDDNNAFTRIWIIEGIEIEQEAAENTDGMEYDQTNEMYIYDKEKLIEHIDNRVQKMADIIKKEAIEGVIDYINDGEDTKFKD